jgi:PAS domain S-box-containing protein
MRVLIADDHEIVRRGVRSLLLADPECEICGEAVDGRDAVARAQELKPDLVVMDISMPNLNGLEATRRVREILPRTKVLILSQHDSREMMRQAIRAGAGAYVCKSSMTTDLLAGIKKLRNGEHVIENPVAAASPKTLDADEILQRSAAFEKELADSEERFRLTFEQAAVGMALVSEDGRWLRVNQKMCDIVGYTQKELRALTYQEITHPADLSADIAKATQLAAGEIDQYSIEKRYIRKDRSTVWINHTVGAVRNPEQKLKYFVSVIEDISARKATEEQLLRTQEELAIIAAQRETEAAALSKLNEWNERLLRTSNLQEGLFAMLGAVIEMLGADKGNVQLVDQERGVLEIAAHCGFQQDFLDFFREVSTKDVSACARGFRSRERVIIEDSEADSAFEPLRPIARSAGYRSVISTPLIDTDGKPLGMVSAHFRSPHRPSPDALRRLDMYARQAASFVQRCRAEEALREREGRYRLLSQKLEAAHTETEIQLNRLHELFENAPAGLALLSGSDHRFTFVNRECLRMAGRARLEDLVGRPAREAMPELEPQGYFDLLDKVYRSNVEYVGLESPVSIQNSDGSPQQIFINFTIQPVRNAGGQVEGLLYHGVDVTAQVTARQTIVGSQEAQARLAAIVESSEDAIISKTLAGSITSWNAAAERMFGYAAKEAIGQPILIIIPRELHAHEKEVLAKIAAGKSIDHEETVRCRKDGTAIDVSVTISPVRDATGKIVGASNVTRDITERKRAEENLKEREFSGRLLQMQDQERRQIARELHDSLGQLAAGIAISASKVEREKSSLSPQAVAAADEIATMAEQLSSEIRTISYLLHPPMLDEMGLLTALRWYVEGFAKRSNISVNLAIPDDTQRLPQDYELTLFRIVQECLNNIHRHSGSSTALVKLAFTPTDIRLEVKDQGHGINPAMQSRIGSGEGIGVGLRGMRERIRPLGGSMKVDSGANGTAVVVTLPLQAKATVAQAH